MKLTEICNTKALPHVFTETTELPIRLWLEDIETDALDQARNLANLPFAYKHIAIMPDSHVGYGMPIGAILATKGVVIPNAVGVDIGCGMVAYNTGLNRGDLGDKLTNILGLCRRFIPLGKNWHKKIHDSKVDRMPDFPHGEIIEQHYSKSVHQLGTLGGGNHFIEIQLSDQKEIWVMIHSGSRNVGKQVADFYNREAVKANERWHSMIPSKWELAFLPQGEKLYDDYLIEMNWCVEFARKNREQMMLKVLEAINEHVGGVSVNPAEFLDVSHNYAAMEHHFGQNVLIHRKGATRAYSDELGIIPGSQGTASYIVKGKGNKDSFMSCSHGAGRIMGRKQAQRKLNLQEELRKMEGIVHGMRHASDLDEAPGSYKDIDVVMNNQKDLVDIEVELKPIAVLKG